MVTCKCGKEMELKKATGSLSGGKCYYSCPGRSEECGVGLGWGGWLEEHCKRCNEAISWFKSQRDTLRVEKHKLEGELFMAKKMAAYHEDRALRFRNLLVFVLVLVFLWMLWYD